MVEPKFQFQSDDGYALADSMIIIAWLILSFLPENPLPDLGDRFAALQAGEFVGVESGVQSLEDMRRMVQAGCGCFAAGNGIDGVAGGSWWMVKRSAKELWPNT